MNITNDTNISQNETEVVGWEFAPIAWTWQTIVLLILAVVGTIGNALVIFVYVKQKKANSCTNTFIIGLAVADLITSLHQFPRPYETSVPDGIGAELYCRFIYVGSSFTMWCSIIASVFSLTLIAVERYIAVVYAVHYRAVFSRKRPTYLLIGCWVASIILNTQSLYICYLDSEDHTCKVAYPSVGFQMFIGASFFLVEFLLPVIVMLYTQTRTVMTLRAQARGWTSQRKETNGPAFSLLQARRRVIEMLFIVVVTFVACWLPDQVAYFCYMMGFLPVTFLNSPTYQAFIVLAFANSCMNPFIYAARNSNFRRILRELFSSSTGNKVHTVNTVAGQLDETMPDPTPQ